MSTPTNSPSKVTIYLKKTDDAQEVIAEFGQCIANHFGFAEAGSGFVGLSHEDDRFTLFGLGDSPLDDPRSVLLKHASLCPVYHKKDDVQLPAELKEKGVGLGVAILLTSSDDFVLVTRRAAHLRTFPGVWVPPGGHVELGETLIDAGLRELHEETGIQLDEQTTYHLLGLWESVYPHKLEFGDPVRQHIVVYLAIQSSFTHRELSERVTLDLEETDAAMWLPGAFVEKLSTGRSTVEPVPDFLTILQQSVDQNGQTTTEEVNIEAGPILQAVAPPPDSSPMDIDRLTWGTRFALQQWTKWDCKNRDHTAAAHL